MRNNLLRSFGEYMSDRLDGKSFMIYFWVSTFLTGLIWIAFQAVLLPGSLHWYSPIVLWVGVAVVGIFVCSGWFMRLVRWVRK